MAKTVIAKYIRLSVDEAKTDSLSIGNQRLLLDQYLMDTDMDDGEILEFVDNGYSGTNFERPAVQELLELVRDGKVGCILVKDFSRFGRDALETGYFIERVFPLFRVRFIAVDDGYDSFAHDGGAGGIEVSFKFLINEQYSRDLSAKIRSAKHAKALRGEAVTKNCAYGYMLDGGRNMVIDPDAADTVRLIFGMYAAKKNLVDIERVLYEEKRLNPLVWKKQRRGEAVDEEFQYVWKKASILSLMRDEQYLGTYIAGKTKPAQIGSRSRVRVSEDEWIRIPNHHPAIVSQELFDAVQEQIRIKGEPLRRRELTTAKRYAAEVTSPLNRKAVCGHCGHSLRISCTKNAAFHCWYTRAADGAACHKLRIPKGELEDVVLKSIRRQAKLVAAAGLHSADVRELSHPAAAEYLAGIEKLKNEKLLLYESLILGDIGPGDYKSRKSAIDAELEESLRVYAAIIGEKQKSLPDADSVQAAKTALRAKKLTDTLADLLIEKVLVFPDNRIEIVWKLSGFLACAVRKEADCVAG